jgi:MtaA/CmuA family methyltransferase
MEDPRPDEVLVRLVASGICHTDIDFCESGAGGAVVLGHEGSGVIERTGRAVRELKPGDHVVLSYQSCGACRACRKGRPADCERFWEANFGFARLDGTNAFVGNAVRGHFFGQSSFATYALATARNTVKVPKRFPLELLAPLGCGLQTGAGTVMNSLAVEAVRRLAEMTRGEVAVRAPGTGPFSLAAHLMGPENFLLELAMANREPGGKGEQSLKHLLELTTDALIAFATACLEAGAHLVQAGDSLASLDMISPVAYRKWAWPAERRFFAAINPLAERHGAVTLLHICGNMTAVLESMADTGAHILELDHKVSLKAASERVGRRVCLMGNLDPVELLWRGTPEAVARAARQAMVDAGAHGGFILGSGCEVPVAAPRENLHAMIESVRRK